ncbi:MAG: hypothetical protein CL840_11710 [Crocinitomicaceae bacterium]|nr:hypothetical protein [Crocinitomicaceae bacterium]|tara:strand:- start:4866 stop:5591 length:726 start_codon:yes stop_codon:yes gene_type:complete
MEIKCYVVEMNAMKLLYKAILFIFLVSLLPEVFAQNIGISSTGAAPDSSAVLDIVSTDKGVLIPRMTTTQRAAISSPATGLMVYDTTTDSFWYYNGSNWANVGSSGNYYSRTTSNLFMTLSYQNIPGWTFALDSGVYKVRAYIKAQETSAANDADLDLVYTGTLGTVSLFIDSEYYQQSGSFDTDNGNGDILITTSSSNTEHVEGYIETTSAGTLTFRFKNSSGAGGTLFIGSTISLIKVN